MSSKLYEEVGMALHKAQLAEYSIVSAYILLSRIGHATSPKQIESSHWSKKTLGDLLKPVVNSNLLPEEAKQFLATFKNARNHLAHSFFVSESDLHTQAGIDSLRREVSAMEDVFDRALQLFERIISDLAIPYEIDVQEIKAQARKTVIDFEK